MTAFLFRYTLGGYRGYLLSISLLYILLSSFFTKVRFPCVGFPCVGKTYVGFSHVVDYYLPRARAKERSGSKYPLNGWSIISPCVGEHVLLVSPCVKRKVSSPVSARCWSLFFERAITFAQVWVKVNPMACMLPVSRCAWINMFQLWSYQFGNSVSMQGLTEGMCYNINNVSMRKGVYTKCTPPSSFIFIVVAKQN